MSLLLVFAVGLRAQSVHGTLAGVVSDAQGAVIPGAAVNIVNSATSATYNQTTTSVGLYRFEDIALGTYTVSVSAPGFKKSVTKGVLVQIGTVASLDVTMQPGAVSEEVTVSSNGLTLETESSDVGGVVTEKQITDLPLALGGVGAMRANEAFVFLQPATTGPGAANSNNGIFFSKVAGGQNFGNEVLIDGVSQQRSENGSSYDEEAPSVEALAEFKVTTSLPEAEFGRTTGGVEDFVTKSGTNDYHGTAYDIYRDKSLDANTWFNNGWRSYYCSGSNDTPACRANWVTPADHKNDYGGTMGGPIRIPKVYNGHDKSFFFFSWEQLKYSTGGTVTSTIPTLAERGGDFSDRLTNIQTGTNPCDGTPIYSGEIFDPATTQTVTLSGGGTAECRTAFGGNTTPTNKIPSGRLSSVAKALVSYYPQPTTTDVFNNYTQISEKPITNTTYSIRIDHNFNDRMKLWGSYNTRENDLFTGNLATLPSPVSTQGWWQDFTTHFFRVGLDYSIKPSLLNYFVFGSNRSNSKNYSQAVNLGKNWNQLVGLTNAGGKNFPLINTGDAPLGLGFGNNGDNVDNGLRLNDALVWTHGRHNIKVGVDLRYQQYSPINGRNEYINFSSNETAGAIGQGGGLGFASMMLGEADNGGTNVVLRGQRWTSWYYAFFAQDDFKITPDLTLNIGLRYDVDIPRSEAHNNTSNFSPTAIDTEYNIPGALVFGDKCHCNTRWADTWYKDFGPRVGFAWSPDFLHQKTVIRGGAGIVYGPLVYDDFGGSMVTGYTANPNAPSHNGFDPSFQIDNGMPAFTPPPDEDPGYYNGSYLPGSYITRDAGRPATVYNWTLEVQHQLSEDLLATVGYIGNHSTDLESNLLNPNNMSQKYFSLGNALYEPFNGNTAGIPLPFPQFLQNWGGNPALQSALRPFPQYDFIDQGCCLENVGMSSFNALIASVSRHFHQGMSLQASYTWGKTFTDADSALPNTNPGIAQDMDVDNLHREKAISAMDIRHTFVFSALYELPFGKGKRFLNHGIASAILGNWELGTVQRMQSGQPLSFGCEWGIPGFQNCIRFSKVPGSSLKSAVYKKGANHINPFVVVPNGGSVDPNANTMFNLEYNDITRSGSPVAGDPVAFYNTNHNYARDCTSATLSNCNSPGLNQPYTFGTGIPRTTSEVRTPPYFNNDLSIIKKFPVWEAYTLSIKAEFLNAFNQHTFGIPDLQPNDYGTFGLPTGTINTPRNIQLTARFTF
ncbi:MAG TPA: TonB-dependent receptor [Terracidiphilus sp.]|nr:TonB-dependent receptor [Terracidiphilus sp.]